MTNLQQNAAGMQPQPENRDWSQEISNPQPQQNGKPMEPVMSAPVESKIPVSQSTGNSGNPELNPESSNEIMEHSVNTQETYAGSLKSLLMQNLGHYIVATFLMGTQNPISWEGFLYSIGDDYLVIFQPDMGRYITGDFYSLKFVEFYGTKGVKPPCPGYRRRDGQQIW